MKKKNMLIRIIFLSMIIALSFTACKKANEEDLRGPVTCDTTNMKYSTNILPLLQAKCFECHGNGLSQEGVTFDTYGGAKEQVDNGNLIKAINHSAGVTPMPFGKPKLSDCDIAKNGK